MLNGTPLICHTIKAALSSNLIDEVFVSSDDKKILEISKNQGASIIHRPDHLATDDASPHDVILHAINTLMENNKKFDLIILLQPTSPLRNYKHIMEAFDIMFKQKSTSLMSVCVPNKSPYKHLIVDKFGYLNGIIDDEMPFMNRQDLPKTLLPNGAVYIFSIKDFLLNNKIPFNKTVPYLMSKEESIDIDCYEDIMIAEEYLKRLIKNE